MNCKRLYSLASMLLLAIIVMAEGKAKYVFYFIGDGMGVNHVNAAEYYLASLEGRIGTTPILFPSFPYMAVLTTYSSNSDITDSAAAGTALASGKKTNSGMINLSPDRTTSYSTIAYSAQAAGAAVGVATSVGVNHATPAAFYASVPDRNMYYEIGKQMAKTNFDFLAGADFLNPTKDGQPDLYTINKEAGYTIARGYKDYQKKCKKADKMIMFQTEAESQNDHEELMYALDQKPGNTTLSDITRAAINFLTKKQDTKNGFFLMVEGGKIDHAAHAGDGAGTITETIDFDNTIKVAYEFYQQHPDETLILVTADHETGGLALGRGKYENHLDNFKYQRMTIQQLGKELHKLHEKYGEKYSIDIVKQFLKENFGFGNGITLSDQQNKQIETAFKHMEAGIGKTDKSWYQSDDELASTVKHIMQDQAQINWAHGAHTGGYVPVFAIGVGAEQFHGRMDNTEVPKVIANATGWELK